MDKNGRVRIPERMLEQFGLGPRVMILGVRDHLELRDPEAWQSTLQEKLEKQGQIMLRARRALYQRPVGGDEESP